MHFPSSGCKKCRWRCRTLNTATYFDPNYSNMVRNKKQDDQQYNIKIKKSEASHMSTRIIFHEQVNIQYKL